MTRRGLLLTLTEPPPAMEEEFNAWYDTEHLAERLAIPGFRSARRWTAADTPPGEGRYLATYELDSPRVLLSAEYLARFEAATPWTRRCLGKAVVFKRWACEQSDPGKADPHPMTKVLLLVCSDTPATVNLASALQTRRFVASSGTPRHISLIELAWAGATQIPESQPGGLMRLYHVYGA